FVQVPWMQSVRGTNRTDVLFRKQFSLLNIFDHKQRAPKPSAVGLARSAGKLDRAESLLGSAYRLHHRLEFLGFERERAVWPAIRPPQTKMFLNDASPQRHGDDRNRDSDCVIRKSHGTAETAPQFRNREQVRLLRWRRIGTGTLQQRNLSRTRSA